jgi:hypothetical protein
MTETLQDRLRAAADVYSEHPPIFCLFFEAADALDHAATERRAFLARAVCHPGPPLSETEDYDPETPLGELEAAILERMDHETEDRRDLWDIDVREVYFHCGKALMRSKLWSSQKMQRSVMPSIGTIIHDQTGLGEPASQETVEELYKTQL